MPFLTKTFRTAVVATFALLASTLAISTAHAQKLTNTPFPDGTGSIGVAPGWELDGAYNGAAQVVGPNGAAVVVKLPWTILRPDAFTDLPGDPNQLRARAGDYGGALREIVAKKLGGTLRSVRGKRLQSLDSGAPAYMLLYEYTKDGQTMTGLGYFAVLDYGQGQPFWQLYSSAVVAPKAQFAKLAPTMIAMWKSWRPNGRKPIEGSSSAMWDKVIEDSKKSYQKIQDDFLEDVLKGTPVNRR